MSIVNSTHLSKIIDLLNISTNELIKNLYVSQSLISRWKNGSRKLNTDSVNYVNLLKFIIKVNKDHGLSELENYVSGFFNEPVYRDDNTMYEQLNKFLISKQTNYRLFPTDNAKIVRFHTFSGLTGRLEAMELFFNTAFNLKDTPDMYIFDSKYYKWDIGPNRYHSTYLSNCLKYMQQGGHIYLFSSLRNTDKESFYFGWRFTTHKNLYPGYFSSFTDDRLAYSYYIIEGVMSMVFYSKSDNTDDYYTAIFTDEDTCKAHLEYIKLLYSSTETQLILNSKNNIDLAVNTVKSFGKNISPILMTSKYPSFLLSERNIIKEILTSENISENFTKTALEYYDYINEKLHKELDTDTYFFFYEEDLVNCLKIKQTIDVELSGIVTKPVYINPEIIKKRYEKIIALMNMSERYHIYIIPKSYAPVYSYIGENNSIWCKRGKWYFIFFEDSFKESRFVTNNIACIARSDMFDDLLSKIPPDISTKEKSIEFLKGLCK